jgi:hypothetical protein
MSLIYAPKALPICFAFHTSLSNISWPHALLFHLTAWCKMLQTESALPQELAREQSMVSSIDRSLTDKVKGVLLDLTDGQSGEVRVLKINLDLLNYHARRLRERGRTDEAMQMLEKCIQLDREYHICRQLG